MNRTTTEIGADLRHKRDRLAALEDQHDAILAELDTERARRVTRLVAGERAEASRITQLESEAEGVQEAAEHVRGVIATLRAEYAEAEAREASDRRDAALQAADDAAQELRTLLRTFGTEQLLPLLAQVRGAIETARDLELAAGASYHNARAGMVLYRAGLSEILPHLESYLNDDPYERMRLEREREAQRREQEQEHRRAWDEHLNQEPQNQQRVTA
jgi:hypothetical protein